MTDEQKARYVAYDSGLDALVNAAQAARERGDIHLSTQVQGGLLRVVRTYCTKRKCYTTLLTGWLPITEATAFINNLDTTN